MDFISTPWQTHPSLVQLSNIPFPHLSDTKSHFWKPLINYNDMNIAIHVCVCACVHVCVCCGGGARLEALRSMELKFSFSLMCGVKKKIIPCFHPLSTLPISDFFAFLPHMYMYSSSLSSRLLSLFLSIWTLSLPNSHALVQWVSANSFCKLIHILSFK